MLFGFTVIDADPNQELYIVELDGEAIGTFQLSFLAGIMRASTWLGSGSSGYLLAITIVLSLISLTAVWFGYAWAKRASGTPAAIVAAVACSFYFGLVYFAPKALTEVVAAHVMLPGLYFGVYGERPGERKRLFFAALLSA